MSGRDMPAPRIGDRVAVNGRTGTVGNILNGPGTPLSCIPENCIQHWPYWYVVEFEDGTSGRYILQELGPADR